MAAVNSIKFIKRKQDKEIKKKSLNQDYFWFTSGWRIHWEENKELYVI